MQLQPPTGLNFSPSYPQYSPQQIPARSFMPPPNQIASQTPLIRRPNQINEIRNVQSPPRQPVISGGYAMPPASVRSVNQQPQFGSPIQQPPSPYLMYGSPQIYGPGMTFPTANQLAPQYGNQPPQPIFLGHRLIGAPHPY